MIKGFEDYCIFREFADNTINNYKIDIGQFLSHLGNNGVEDVTSSDIIAWLSKFNSAATKARKLSSLKTFFTWLNKVERKISINPVENIQTPKIPKRHVNYVKKEEYFGVTEKLEDRNYKYNNRDIFLFDLLFNCGLRISEAVSLDIRQIKPNEKKFSIVGKGNKERTVYMNDTVIDSLSIWLKDREKLLNEKGTSSNAVFITKTSDRLSVRGAQKIVESKAETNAHAFRHGFCTELAKKGVNSAIIGALAGHQSPNTTARYIHAADETMFDVVGQLTR